MDADVIVQNSFDNIWLECMNNIMLYDINHGLQVNDYKSFVSETQKFLNISCYITHFGGEFFAANKQNSTIFIEECKIYNKMVKNKFVTTKGDELILSIAAYNLKKSVKNAGAYI
ncbi:MAG: hypothetical protein IJA94_06185 [Bacilli bacterium]|nr:hypothetical protein [Bacilli bacterium]